jgi:Zn-dependent protease with chaperone function
VWHNCLAGIIAGIIAAAILGTALALAPQAGFAGLGVLVEWPVYGATAALLIILGGGICALAASLATNRYLRKEYGELFR